MKITVHNIMRQNCVDINEKDMWEIVDSIDEGSGIEKFFESRQLLLAQLRKAALLPSLLNSLHLNLTVQL